MANFFEGAVKLISEFSTMLGGINPLALSSLSFLVGTLVGNWVAIGRDKRKEWNDFVLPLRESLITRLGAMISKAQLDTLNFYLTPWVRRRLRAAIDRYERCYQEQMKPDQQYGAYRLQDPDAVRRAAQDVLACLRLR